MLCFWTKNTKGSRVLWSETTFRLAAISCLSNGNILSHKSNLAIAIKLLRFFQYSALLPDHASCSNDNLILVGQTHSSKLTLVHTPITYKSIQTSLHSNTLAIFNTASGMNAFYNGNLDTFNNHSCIRIKFLNKTRITPNYQPQPTQKYVDLDTQQLKPRTAMFWENTATARLRGGNFVRGTEFNLKHRQPNTHYSVLYTEYICIVQMEGHRRAEAMMTRCEWIPFKYMRDLLYRFDPTNQDF